MGYRITADRPFRTPEQSFRAPVGTTPAGINASHLSDYLVDEVLDSVDLSTRHFLLKSAILRSMNDALIVRVTGEENGQMRLEEIERQGLFLQRMDDIGEWFSYHPLFGNFLRQRCQWELAAELPEIHRAAAESWMEQGFPSEAIHHALAAGDAHMLRDILLNHAWGCLTTASWRCWKSH